MKRACFWPLLAGLIIFRWGPPQPSFQDYQALVIGLSTPLPDGRTVGEIVAERERLGAPRPWPDHRGLRVAIRGWSAAALAMTDRWPLAHPGRGAEPARAAGMTERRCVTVHSPGRGDPVGRGEGDAAQRPAPEHGSDRSAPERDIHSRRSTEPSNSLLH
jgi:hypothetical protein